MKRAILPLLLGFAASAAIACPGAEKSADAKASTSTTVTSALSAVTQQSKAEADKKVIKRIEAKKPTS
jgi:ABC-type glycerol-3-phosphate transport system substrate-binding protein